MLGLPPCSQTQWQNILKRLEPRVAALAEWSCGQVRKEIVMRGDEKKWIASFDGFYLTRGHYSNNASASMHDFVGGGIAWYTHRTKRGPGHNWEGTPAGAEGDMFDEVLGMVKEAGFDIQEIIMIRTRLLTPSSAGTFQKVRSPTATIIVPKPSTRTWRRSGRTSVR